MRLIEINPWRPAVGVALSHSCRTPRARPHFLIANPRLETCPTRRKQTAGAIPNSEFLQDFAFCPRTASASRSSVHVSRHRRSICVARRLSLACPAEAQRRRVVAFLIDTACRLEIALTHSKQMVDACSNRRWIRSLHSPVLRERFAAIRRSSAAPASIARLLRRASQSKLVANPCMGGV